MKINVTYRHGMVVPAWASLALTVALLALSLVLMAGLAYAQTGSISGTVTYRGGAEPGTYHLNVDLFANLEQPPVADMNLPASGPYTFDGLADGTYYVCVSVDTGPGSSPYTCYDLDSDGEADPAVVSGGGAVTGIDVALGGPWLPLGGPMTEGGQANAVAAHPTISGTVYAAVAPLGAYDSGPSVIYKTDDGAASWTPVYTADHQIYSLGVTGTLVYAGAFNPGGEGVSIYASYDSGASWTPVFSSTDRGVWLDISVHPTDTDVAIIGGWFYHQQGEARPQSGLVYRTDDAGMTWTPILSATFAGAEAGLNAVMMHPVTPTLLLASVHTWGGPADQDSYLYRSDDGGATWPISVTMPNAHIVSFAANTSQPAMLYAGAGFGPFSGGRAAVFRSLDEGLSWDEVHSEGTHLAFESPSTIYTVMDSGQAYVSTSDGDPGTWVEIGGIWDQALSFDIDLGPVPAALYAAGQQRGIFKGTYDGANWNWDTANSGIQGEVVPIDIDVDPQDPDKMFVAAECSGGWLTGDGGQAWSQPSGLGGCMGAFAINPDNPEIVYGGAYDCSRGAVLRSDNGGLDFGPVYTATFIISDCTGPGEQIHALAIAPAMTAVVYAGGSDEYPDASRAVIVRSLDDGLSWTEVFTLPGHSRVKALVIDPTDEYVVYAGGEDCHDGPCEGFVYRTTDGGDTWEQTLVTSDTITSIVVDRQKPNVLYAATRGPYDVYKSTDGGDTWALIRSNNPPFEEASGYLLAMDPHVPSHVYLGGWGYIAETADGGLTWSDWGDPLNFGTPGMEPAALTVDNGTVTQTLYAGFSGVWAYSRPAPQPGEAMTVTAWADEPSAPVGSMVDVHALAVDQYENWVADGTEVTFSTSPEGSFDGSSSVVETTTDGQASVVLTGVAAGTATITAAADGASGVTTIEFLSHYIYLPIVLRNAP